MAHVMQVLEAMEQGQPQAAEALLPLVYDELRRLARTILARERPGQTLQATALVHEAYLRLVGPAFRVAAEPREPAQPRPQDAIYFDSRGHFFAAAAEAMRRILVEGARRKGRLKRGGDRARQPWEDQIASPTMDVDLIELDAAMEKLAQQAPRKAELVKLRYFAGLTQQQAAEILGISISTADRDWAYSRAWLFREINGSKEA